MITLVNTKVCTLSVVTPPGAAAISRAIFKPGITWAELKAKIPTPKLQGAPFQHWSQTCNGAVIGDDVVFNESSMIYGVFDNTVIVTATTGTIPTQYQVPVVPGTTMRNVIAVLPKFRKPDHSLTFWSLDGSSAVDPLHRIMSNTSISAVWTADASTIQLTFDNAGMFEDVEAIRVKPGTQWNQIKSMILYPEPLRKGVVFKHWSLDKGGEAIGSNRVFNADTTIHMVGAEVSEFIDIRFDPHGGDAINPLLHQPKGILYGYIKQQIGDPVRKTDPDRFDEFAGWSNIEYADEELSADYKIENTCVLYAQWVTRIDVTIKNNGDDRTISTEANYWPYSDALKQIQCLPDGIPEEHTFRCWSLSQNGPDMGDAGKFVKDTNVYAVYDPYTVITADTRGGSAVGALKAPINTNWAALKGQLTNPTKDLHTFSHWSLTATGDPIEDNHAFAGDVTIYAVWIPYVNILVETGSGSEFERFKVPHGTKWKEIKDRPQSTMEGHRVSHWSLTDAGAAIDDEHAFTDPRTTIHAVWIKTWVVTFNADGGSPTQAPITVDDGTSWANIKSKVTEPAKSGYVFTGWDIEQ